METVTSSQFVMIEGRRIAGDSLEETGAASAAPASLSFFSGPGGLTSTTGHPMGLAPTASTSLSASLVPLHHHHHHHQQQQQQHHHTRYPCLPVHLLASKPNNGGPHATGQLRPRTHRHHRDRHQHLHKRPQYQRHSSHAVGSFHQLYNPQSQMFTAKATGREATKPETPTRQ
ncbi:unnamed protein product, partial [Protopolystoma xenopodis]